MKDDVEHTDLIDERHPFPGEWGTPPQGEEEIRTWATNQIRTRGRVRRRLRGAVLTGEEALADLEMRLWDENAGRLRELMARRRGPQ